MHPLVIYLLMRLAFALSCVVRVCTPGGITRGGNERVEQGIGDFHRFGVWWGCLESRVGGPQRLPHQRQGIDESWQGFGIPDGTAQAGPCKSIGHQGDA